ncbi:translocation/assembly module TamB domain-containing protein [Stieleria varia]|uniref:AsmA-like C-terminal domain-containing protein n=1 Tax=Stieleria varia TaxID=2528005 RepID=A0A5C5ZZD2_9BACT|nr:hypothetical protein [Stieleria varia]TWT92391.1 hypothetical protein Pla52n_62650 [Stieleria varia]
MATDEFLLDQAERNQQDRLLRRRDNRSRRRRYTAIAVLLMLALFVLAGPSFVSHTSIGTSLLSNTLSGYGLDGQVESMRVGWITPLRLRGLSIKSRPVQNAIGAAPDERSGSEILVEQVDTELTILDLFSFDPESLGNITVRDLNIRCSVDNGVCSLERDLQPLMQGDDQGSGNVNGHVHVENATVEVIDLPTGRGWSMGQSHMDVQMTGRSIEGSLAGVLTEPSGNAGSLQTEIHWSPADLSGTSPAATPAGEMANAGGWRMNLTTESLPLSVTDLLIRRFPEMLGQNGPSVTGEATGKILLSGNDRGNVEASIEELRIRDLSVAGLPGRQGAWKNAMASLDGEVSLVDRWVIGRGLKATTDFAVATLDGAFSTEFSLVGADDNPLRWLEALDGQASVDVDLAAFDQAMPGMIPLRDDAQLISGHASATIQSVAKNDNDPASTNARQSRLIFASDSLRARAHGRAVVVQPIELTAMVSNRGGRVHADEFQWTSSFATATGSGDLQTGQADLDIDFGRLYAMLRPVVDLSDVSLGGNATGRIRWNATNQNLWQLTGSGNATNLLIALPDGHRIQRSSVQCDVNAVGRWNGQSLAELSQANFKLLSNGMDLRAELSGAVANPTSASRFPIQLYANGRIENVAQTLRPWLPEATRDAEGAFVLNADGMISSDHASISKARIDITRPRIAYGANWISQPRVTIDFQGGVELPSGDFNSRSLQVVGDAISLAAEGEWNREKVALQLAWRADLKRLQDSMQPRMARAAGNIQQAAFDPQAPQNFNEVPVPTSSTFITGTCEGKISVRSSALELGAGLIELESQTTAKDVAFHESSPLNVGFGPQPRTLLAQNASALDQIVWLEPNVKINTVARYDSRSGTLSTDDLQISGDWFATTLSGDVVWNDVVGKVELDGPSRFKMDEVARRLTALTGTRIDAVGIHETPLKIAIARGPQDALDVQVDCNMGWESVAVAGVNLGPCSIPLHMTDSIVRINPCVIPVEGGQVDLAGDIFYRPGPVAMQLAPGTKAQNVRITQQMTSQWLKYLAPIAADATQVDGTIGAEIDEAFVNFDAPQQSRVRGRLNIERLQLSPGPLANQVVQGVDQLKSLSQGALAVGRDVTGKTLVTMPPQSVDFAVGNGVVTHQRMYLQIDRAQLITSGQVGMNGSVNLVAQVPLDARWIGRDLQGMAGQSVSMPITGTLSQPRLDPRGVRDLVMQLGTQAVQNKLQEEVATGLEKLFGF